MGLNGSVIKVPELSKLLITLLQRKYEKYDFFTYYNF